MPTVPIPPPYGGPTRGVCEGEVLAGTVASRLDPGRAGAARA